MHWSCGGMRWNPLDHLGDMRCARTAKESQQTDGDSSSELCNNRRLLQNTYSRVGVGVGDNGDGMGVGADVDVGASEYGCVDGYSG